MEQTKQNTVDASRQAYMLRWRDRMIEHQSAIIAGQNEQISLLEALLSFSLGALADVPVVREACAAEDTAHTCRIPKEAVSTLLREWTVTVSDQDAAYCIAFEHRPRGSDDADSEQAHKG